MKHEVSPMSGYIICIVHIYLLRSFRLIPPARVTLSLVVPSVSLTQPSALYVFVNARAFACLCVDFLRSRLCSSSSSSSSNSNSSDTQPHIGALRSHRAHRLYDTYEGRYVLWLIVLLSLTYFQFTAARPAVLFHGCLLCVMNAALCATPCTLYSLFLSSSFSRFYPARSLSLSLAPFLRSFSSLFPTDMGVALQPRSRIIEKIRYEPDEIFLRF